MMWTSRLQTILAMVGVLWLAGCGQQPDTSPETGPIARAEPAGQAATVQQAEPVGDWPETSNVSRAGRFYFAGQPGEAAFRKAAADGVTMVINLRTKPEVARLPFDEPVLVAELGMKYVNIPVMPAEFSPAIVDRFAEVVDSTDQPVLVHCGSSDRVGGMWAAYLARTRGMQWDQALELGRTAGLHSPTIIESARRAAAGP